MNEIGIRVQARALTGNNSYLTIIGVYSNNSNILNRSSITLNWSNTCGLVTYRNKYYFIVNNPNPFIEVSDTNRIKIFQNVTDGYYLNGNLVPNSITQKNLQFINPPVFEYYTYTQDDNKFDFKEFFGPLDTEVVRLRHTPQSYVNSTIPSNCTLNDLQSISINLASPITNINTNKSPYISIVDDNGNWVKKVDNVSTTSNTINLGISLSSLNVGTYYLYIPCGTFDLSAEPSNGEIIIPINYVGESSSPEPIVPDPEEPIEYVTPSNINYDNGVTFNGLIKYKNNNVISNFSGKVTRNDNVIFINSQQVDEIDILPTLRTYVKQGDNYFWTIFNELPVSVTVTLNIYHNDGSKTIKVYNTQYNQEFQLPYSDGRAFLLKLDFKVGETHLSKEIKFYKLSNSLYTKYITNSNSENYNTFQSSEYSAVFDLISETPVVSKWGCLLLTNTYDVIETVKVNNTPKGVAELVPTTKVRMGNLSGIYNETFGTNQPRGFGLYGESVYLTGNFYLNNGKSLIDINNDVTLAVGNINRIQNALNNLNSSLLNSIYNLTISQAETNNSIETAKAALTASFNEAIANNNDALFKLGKDYSLWAVGNAGISIINPNVSYDGNGNVDDSTVGDGDEYIFLQGESVQIATSISKEYNNQNYIKVIVSNTNPQSFVYNNNNLYNPFLSSDLQTQPQFSVGWVESTVLHNAIKVSVNASENTKLFRYVALNKHLNQNNGQLTIANTNLNIEDHDFYSFSVSRQLTGTSIYSDNTFTNTFDNNEYYVIKDVVISGMFVDGKFNANLIEVKNILAVDLSSEENGVKIYKKNPNFDITQPISDNNYPVLKNSNNSIAKDAPFAVISGTTGKITAQGVDLRGATIGDANGPHIRLTDNIGVDKVNDKIKDWPATFDNTPAIYIRNGENIIAKFSGVTNNDLSYYFKGKGTSVNRNTPTTLFNENDNTFILNRKLVGTYSTNQNNNTNGFFTNTLAPSYDVFDNIADNNYDYFEKESYARNHVQHADVGAITYSVDSNNNPTANFFSSLSDPIDISSNGTDITIKSGSAVKIEGFINSVKLLQNCVSYTPKKISEDDNSISNDDKTTIGNLALYIPGEYTITLYLKAVVDGNSNETIKSWDHCYKVIMDYEDELINNIIRQKPILKNSNYDNLTGDIVFSRIIKNDTGADKNYKLYLQAQVRFKQYAQMQSFRCSDQNLPDGSNPTLEVPDDIGFMPIYNEDENESTQLLQSAYPAPIGTRYSWKPLMCPDSYTLRPQITIQSINITAADVKQETVVQGNGFASGYSFVDYFSNGYRQNGDTLQFDRINLVNGCGTKDSNSGIYNLFRLPDGENNEINYNDYVIPRSIPILYGDMNFHSKKSDYSDSMYFHYYKFNGYSIVACERGDYYIDTYGRARKYQAMQDETNTGITNSAAYVNAFSSTNPFEIRIIGGGAQFYQGTVLRSINYDVLNDLYLCTDDPILYNNNTYSSSTMFSPNYSIMILFGNSWNKIFSKFGTTVLVQLISLGYNGLPRVVNLISINRGVQLNLKRYYNSELSDADENLFQNTNKNKNTTFECRLGIWINSYDLSASATQGNFNIMVNYIPQMV